MSFGLGEQGAGGEYEMVPVAKEEEGQAAGVWGESSRV